VGEEGEYTLGESLMEGKGTFGSRNSRSSEVGATIEREGGEERKKKGRGGRKGSSTPLCPEGRQPRPLVHCGAAQVTTSTL
jgi:hypothetical protein